jgi:hypothetical protein
VEHCRDGDCRDRVRRFWIRVFGRDTWTQSEWW